MPSYKEKKQKLKELVKKEEQQRRKIIQEEGHKFVDSDSFKRAEKHYKYYVHCPTDFSKMVKVQELPCKQVQGKLVYTIPSPEGAYVVKNFCNVQQQYQIGFEALNRYIYRPYRTNLDGTNGLYEKEQEAKQKMQENLAVLPTQVKDENGNALYYFNQKIRMTNLGYQYDWPKRCYPSTKVCVPETILQMTERAIDLYQQISGTKIDYKGEAVIVNFYKPRDYMIGHLDDGEIDQVNPIFSFCFGLSCVFLIGYPEKQKQPLAIELQAGDLMIMSGFSRICYHGVPRIIEDSYKVSPADELNFQLQIPPNSEGIKFINQKEQVLNYFKTHRLNVNIRQVYPSKKDDKQQQIQQKQGQIFQQVISKEENTDSEVVNKQDNNQ